jgi:hypothetical protein
MAPVEPSLPHASKPSATTKISLLGAAAEDRILNLELEMLGRVIATMPANSRSLRKQRAAIRVNNKLRGTRRQ